MIRRPGGGHSGREQSSLGTATHVGSREAGRKPREWPLETSGVHVQNGHGCPAGMSQALRGPRRVGEVSRAR